MADSDFYLQIDTIIGESESVGFEKQMQISSWSFGATNSGSAAYGGGLGTGKVNLQDFSFTITHGKASPQLFLACAKGNHIPSAVLTCRKTGGGGSPFAYLKITFGDLIISSRQIGGSDGSGLPHDSISFNFSNIKEEYFLQKPDGSVALNDTAVYDTKKVEGRAG